ncbi:MAG: hydrogenase [Bacteroidota bacterium]
MNEQLITKQSHRLLRYGIILFLLGLLTGFAIPGLENSRMGLSSHLEGTLNGMFLILLGLLWNRLQLSARTLSWGYGLALFGTYANWTTTLLAAIWGAGAAMMPFAGQGLSGDPWQEIIIETGLLTLSIAMVTVSVMVIWGLRGNTPYHPMT